MYGLLLLANIIKLFSQPILVLFFFLHLLSNKVLSSYTPVWTDSSIKYALGAMSLTKFVLDMLIEDTRKALWAMYSLKIPEIFTISVLSYNLSLESIGVLKLYFLFFKGIYEFIDDFIESL